MVVAAVAGLSRRVHPQDTTSCSFDTAAHTVLRSVTLSLLPERRGRDVPLESDDYLYAAQAIQTYFQRPSQVRLPLWARTVGHTPTPGTLSTLPLRGLVRFRLDRVGRLADQDIVVDYPSQDLGQSLVAAVRRADSANAFPPPGSAVLHDHGTIRIRLAEFSDSVGTQIPLIRLMVPAVIVDSVPSLISGPRLIYPEALRQAGLGGRVELRLLVLPNGHIDPNSVDLVAARYRGFAVRAVDWVQGAKFRPASIGECAVPMVITLPIDFKIKRNE